MRDDIRPGMTVDGRTVVASVILDDRHAFETRWTVILLNAETPYFSIAEVLDRQDGTYVVAETETTHMNIVPAVAEYEQRGGDF